MKIRATLMLIRTLMSLHYANNAHSVDGAVSAPLAFSNNIQNEKSIRHGSGLDDELVRPGVVLAMRLLASSPAPSMEKTFLD